MAGARIGTLGFLDQVARRMVPALITASFILLTVLPAGHSALGRVTPALPIIAVYYWAMSRPMLMPPLLVLALGLVQDMVGGTPPGLMGLALLSVHAFVVREGRFLPNRSFLSNWLGFAGVCAAALGGAWIVYGLFVLDFVEPRPFIVQWLLTVLFYPAVAWLLGRIAQRALVTD